MNLSSVLAKRMDAKRAALAQALDSLRAYAREHDGRFLLYGSTARGDYRLDSDVDIIADFGPDAASRRAGSAAEGILARFGLKADARAIYYCGQSFLDQIAEDAVELK